VEDQARKKAPIAPHNQTIEHNSQWDACDASAPDQRSIYRITTSGFRGRTAGGRPPPSCRSRGCRRHAAAAGAAS
jgi:hypothetical protein